MGYPRTLRSGMTVWEPDLILNHQLHACLTCPRLPFCLICWAREAVASTSSEFDHISTMQPFVESSSVSISTRWSHPLDVRYALQRSWCVDEDCHRSFWGSSFEFFRKSVEGVVRKGVVNFSLHHVFEKIWKIWSHVSENDQWQSSSMHQYLCNAYLTSSVCDHLVEMLKLELSTKGCMVETWSNLELAEAITSRAQRIKQKSKEGQCCPWIKE
jgi:hypothetical protein